MMFIIQNWFCYDRKQNSVAFQETQLQVQHSVSNYCEHKGDFECYSSYCINGLYCNNLKMCLIEFAFNFVFNEKEFYVF
jgi:hypothetical protein